MYSSTAVLEQPKFISLDIEAAIRKHMPLVQRIANHVLSRLPASVQLSWLVQAGLIGLMDAITRYERAQGIPFEAYASQRIRGAIVDELRANDWFPREARRTQRKIDTSLAKLEQKFARPPTEAEVAKELGVPLEDYQAMLAKANGLQLLFFDDMGGEEGDAATYMERHLADTEADPLAQLSDVRFRKDLVKAIEALPDREQLLMSLYYEKELNFKEIAAVLGVTESRVCQLHAQAVLRLRGKLKSWTA